MSAHLLTGSPCRRAQFSPEAFIQHEQHAVRKFIRVLRVNDEPILAIAHNGLRRTGMTADEQRKRETRRFMALRNDATFPDAARGSLLAIADWLRGVVAG